MACHLVVVVFALEDRLAAFPAGHVVVRDGSTSAEYAVSSSCFGLPHGSTVCEGSSVPAIALPRRAWVQSPKLALGS